MQNNLANGTKTTVEQKNNESGGTLKNSSTAMDCKKVLLHSQQPNRHQLQNSHEKYVSHKR